ncbi:MAG: hypothetical protein ABF629_15220 [Sporolactobacillus sp.]|nr:hypothetical protein [Sporolactobacillus sp. STSJ-5]MCQ2009285.1 hypothetical protein [Sporolactobacillus sp. STSJ-5]
MAIHYKSNRRNIKQRNGKPLTDEDIKRLMNVSMPTYRRVKGGALKQR